MTADPHSFKAPFIDQRQCWDEADAFRADHLPSAQVPVDILALVEFDLNLNVRTISNLKEDADVDALLLGDWKTLIVDQRQYMDVRFENRLRFSIAHELGHFELHRAVFDSIPRNSPSEWITFILEIPEKEYRLLEFHANEFAGRFVVPLEELKNEFDLVLSEVERNGLKKLY